MSFGVSSDAGSVSPIPVLDLSRLESARPRRGESVIKLGLVAAALVSVGTTVAIVAALASPAIDFFRSIGLREFFTSKNWSPTFEPAQFGARPLFTATLLITLIALASPFRSGSRRRCS